MVGPISRCIWKEKIVSASAVYFLAFGGLRDSKNPEFRIPPRAKQQKTIFSVKLLPSFTSASAIKVKLRHYNPARVKRSPVEQNMAWV